jgi:hypothetical protein
VKSRAQKKAEQSAHKFWRPTVGWIYIVRGYYTGEFIGQVESCDRDIAVLTVIDPLRPHQKRGCPFPQCIAELDHDGLHQFPTLCAGAKLEIPWKLARFDLPEVRVIEFRSRAASWDNPRGAA